MTKAVEDAVNKKTAEITEASAPDLRNALRAIDDELGRFGERLKRLEECKMIHESDAMVKSKDAMTMEQCTGNATQSVTEGTNERLGKENSGSVSANQTKSKTAKKKTRPMVATQQEHKKGEYEANESKRSEPETGWTLVERKKKKSKQRRYGAVLIGGQNVTRIKAAAMDEFQFDQNVSFVYTNTDEFQQKLSDVTNRSRAKQIDVVIHLGAEDAIEHSADYVLDRLTHKVNQAREQKRVDTVYVCSLEERRDAGANVHQNVKTINTELAQLCHSTGATFVDLRSRLEETEYGGINRTGILYTFEGARNVAQHILSQIPGFLD